MKDYLTIIPNFVPNDGIFNPPQRAGKCAAVWHFFLAQTPETQALSAGKVWEVFNKAVPGQNLKNFEIEWPRARRWYNADRQKYQDRLQTQSASSRAAASSPAPVPSVISSQEMPED